MKTRRTRLGKRSAAGLLLLNAALLVGLGAVVFAPHADAQARSRNTYTMVVGHIRGQIPPVAYIVSEGSAELVAVSWDEQNKTLTGMGYRNLVADMSEVGRIRN